uniref:PCQ3_87 n=1 Tax=Streptomyces sp. W9 TaxID=682410 RepID=D0UZD6_9ACTN|nr:pCQ3_87 [Streptomyces sp. W9]
MRSGWRIHAGWATVADQSHCGGMTVRHIHSQPGTFRMLVIVSLMVDCPAWSTVPLARAASTARTARSRAAWNAWAVCGSARVRPRSTKTPSTTRRSCSSAGVGAPAGTGSSSCGATLPWGTAAGWRRRSRRMGMTSAPPWACGEPAGACPGMVRLRSSGSGKGGGCLRCAARSRARTSLCQHRGVVGKGGLTFRRSVTKWTLRVADVCWFWVQVGPRSEAWSCRQHARAGGLRPHGHARQMTVIVAVRPVTR